MKRASETYFGLHSRRRRVGLAFHEVAHTLGVRFLVLRLSGRVIACQYTKSGRGWHRRLTFMAFSALSVNDWRKLSDIFDTGKAGYVLGQRDSSWWVQRKWELFTSDSPRDLYISARCVTRACRLSRYMTRRARHRRGGDRRESCCQEIEGFLPLANPGACR